MTKANRGGDLSKYGIETWDKFFSERQLLVMLTLLKNIKIVVNDIQDKEYAKVVSTYLAIFLCKHINYNSIGVAWASTAQKLAHALSFRVPRIIFNHAEPNPFEKTSGALEGMLGDLVKGIKFASINNNKCNVSLGSVLSLSNESTNRYDLIITDPPYMDDVPYAEVSDFFYVWLYRALRDFYPELPPASPAEEDISVSRTRFGSNILANDFYNRSMKEAFKQIFKSLKDDGLLVLFFAHSSTEAWNILLEVLRGSRFQVVSSYAIHTESADNMIARGKTSFMSSIVVACRKIHEEKTAYFEDILPEIEDKIKNMLKKLTLEELMELPMTDLLIMTYGKVLEESTKHLILKSYRSDFKGEFETLIKDAREFILKEIVTKLTGRSPAVLGPDMSFYMITKAFYQGILDSNEALKVAWAYSIDLEELERKQVAKKQSGVTRLTFFDEAHFEKHPDEVDRNNLHEQLMYLERIAEDEGVSAVIGVTSQHNNFRVQDLMQIINLLIKNYRIRRNKAETLTIKEQKEMKILESLADTFGSSRASLSVGKTLEEFMG